MKIELRFFASVRETLDTAAETVTLPDEVKTTGEVRKFLAARGGVWETALGSDKPLRIACNQKMTGEETRITDGCEIAFFPPVTGGCHEGNRKYLIL